MTKPCWQTDPSCPNQLTALFYLAGDMVALPHVGRGAQLVMTRASAACRRPGSWTDICTEQIDAADAAVFARVCSEVLLRFSGESVLREAVAPGRDHPLQVSSCAATTTSSAKAWGAGRWGTSRVMAFFEIEQCNGLCLSRCFVGRYASVTPQPFTALRRCFAAGKLDDFADAPCLEEDQLAFRRLPDT